MALQVARACATSPATQGRKTLHSQASLTREPPQGPVQRGKATNKNPRSLDPKSCFPVPGSVPRPRECHFLVIWTDTDRFGQSFSSNRWFRARIVTIVCQILTLFELFFLFHALLSHVFHVGTPEIYTPTGFGHRKNTEMAGVDDLVVYMQTAVKYNTFYIHHPWGAKRPRGGVYTNWYILQQFAYTPPNRPHQPFPYFF